MALGYFFNMYRNKCPLKGGTPDLYAPCTDAFDPVHHPSYIRFFNRLLPGSRDAYYLEKRYQDEFAYNPTTSRCIVAATPTRRAPFYMYYWGQAGREWCSDVIAVGPTTALCRTCLAGSGPMPLAEAISMGRSRHGRSSRITCCTTRRSSSATSIALASLLLPLR